MGQPETVRNVWDRAWDGEGSKGLVTIGWIAIAFSSVGVYVVGKTAIKGITKLFR